jgi:TetR/AcrR family transcriptional regulator, cholesterol catabolism regulator
MDNKLDQICDTALGMFITDGYAQTPLSRIASAVGLTKAGLYHYFKSKEELLFLIHERHLQRLFIPILEEAETIPDPRERIAYFIKAYTRHCMVEDASAKVLVHEVGNLMPEHREIIENVWKRTLNLLRNAILEMEKAGDSKKHNKTFAAFAALGMCSWTFYWFDFDRRQSAEELAETYVDIFLNGLTDSA